MPHILAATDFSTRSDRALRRAGLLARQIGATLTLVHVVDDDRPSSLVEIERRESARLLHADATSVPELRETACRTLVAAGDAFAGILEAARDQRADLVVLGSHRKQLLRDVFVGTTIERVVRAGSVPVLMVNRELMGPYRGVLVATDLSQPSANAIAVGQTLGLIGERDVTIAHAFTAPAKQKLLTADTPREQIDEYVASERLRASEALFSFLDERGVAGPPWSHRIEEGYAFEVIRRLDDEIRPDLVVLGTRGLSGMRRALLGSVAEQVLRSLDVDVLAVPPPA